MLTPRQLQEIVETMYPMLDDLNTWITKDLIKRLMARLGRGEKAVLGASDEWQMQVLQSAGGHLEAVQREVARFTELADAEIARIFEDAGIKALAADNMVYVRAGMEELALSEGMVQILADTYQRTLGTVHNLTRTTATESQRKLIRLLDEAHMRVITGAQSYTAAVEDIVKAASAEESHVIYPSGHVDTVEVAVLRAVRTGTAQASGNMSLQGMIDRDWDLIRVSAHLGARYGDGGENPGNHFWWQGKLYSRTGRTPGYPLFEQATGYGTGEGCCGWNCRHSFGPGDPNHNPFKDYDAEENKKAYDLSQRQRRMERAVKASKHKLVGLREAIDTAEDAAVKAKLEAQYASVSSLLGRQNTAYNEFCEKNDLKRLADRLQIARWTREDARRSILAAREKSKAS